ncbi:MAG: 50S ribosomal protein L29 [Actinomycetota bacterium]|nr:50S ribosomal protein L29 [Actinomycetota bacterium]
MTKASELRALDVADLDQRLADARKELFNLRFQLATGRLDNVSRIGTLRKEVARLRTLETERAQGRVVPAPEATGGSTKASRRRAGAENEEQ